MSYSSRAEVKLPWNPKLVKEFILKCREDGGVPMFKTKHIVPFIYAGSRSVLGICWGGKGNAPDSVLFYDVPENEIKELEKEVGDWKYLLLKYGSIDELIRALEYPIILHTYKETADLLRKIEKLKKQ